MPPFTISLNNRKILDAFFDAKGILDKRASILRVLDKLPKLGRDRVVNELAATFTTYGPEETINNVPVVTYAQAYELLNFVEDKSGSPHAILRQIAAELNHPLAIEGIQNLREIVDLLDAGGVPESYLKIDVSLARGLDYYTGVVFETTVNRWERYGSVSSGGRYDNLASLFTERRLPGVGASIGLDRLLALMEEAGWLGGNSTTAPVLVANFPGVAATVPFGLAARLRRAGIGAEVYPDPIQVGKQMGYGSTRGHRFAVIVGPDEMAGGLFNLRDLATRQERKAVPQADLESAVGDALGDGS